MQAFEARFLCNSYIHNHKTLGQKIVFLSGVESMGFYHGPSKREGVHFFSRKLVAKVHAKAWAIKVKIP